MLQGNGWWIKIPSLLLSEFRGLEMLIKVGSKNPTKVDAVREVMKDYFPDAEVRGVEVDSGVGCQPKSMRQTIQGADRRAYLAFKDCDFSIGLESGMVEASGKTKTGYLNVLFCSIYDGVDFYIGMSSGFEIPQGAIETVIRDDSMDISDALYFAGYTTERRIGYGKGFIHILTKGRVCRQDLVIQAVQMAMLQIENKHWY